MKYKKTPLALPLLTLLFLSGCETLQTPQQRQQAAARQQAATRHSAERVRLVQGQVETVEMENERLMQELQSLQRDSRSYNNQIAQLNRKMSALEAKQSREMKELIKQSTEQGMQTFDQSLFDLFEMGLINYQDALRNADSVNDLRLRIKLDSKLAKNRDLLAGTEDIVLDKTADDPGMMR